MVSQATQIGIIQSPHLSFGISDMLNHVNDHVNGNGHNIAHKYNPFRGDRIDLMGYEFYATKTIDAGEELLFTYNR